jgi:hypothetical protein
MVTPQHTHQEEGESTELFYRLLKVVDKSSDMNHVQFLHSGEVQNLHSLGVQFLHAGVPECNFCVLA